MKRILVTGGAGFIGSHLVDALMSDGVSICVFDSLSSGSLQNIKQWLDNSNFAFTKGNLLNPTDLKKLNLDHCETVFHLTANPEIRVSSTNPKIHFQQNVVATYRLLEHLRKTGNISKLVFVSPSTVYCEPAKIPTPEDYAPLDPISIYGATKLACEALITAYAHTYNFKAVIYRLANIVGPRNKHGVIHDFIQKLEKNPNELEILGDGTQNKSYLYISDCIEAILFSLEKTKNQVEIYNVGSEDQIDVKTIAEIVVEEMGLKGIEFKFTGGVDGGRGWKGDVKNMLLDITKIRNLGWKPKHNTQQAITKTIKELTRQQVQKLLEPPLQSKKSLEA